MQASEKTDSAISKAWRSIVSLATNKYFAAGLLALILLIAAGYFFVDRMIMPSYVGHNVSVTVPSVKELPIEEARLKLEAMDLRVEVESGRYNPQIPRNIVVDQNPQPNMYVKPGRRIYLTINTGATPEVTVPSVVGLGRSDAENQLTAAGLLATESDIRPDSIPYPAPNIITRQYPSPGTVLKEGSRVRLWYSTGLGDKYVTVPSVIDLTASEAQRMLLSMKLRSRIIEYPDATSLIVNNQSPRQGTRAKEGSEIRLFVNPPEEEEN